MNIYEFAAKHLYPFKIDVASDGTKEITAKHCPFCGLDTYDTYKFSLNIDKEVYQCFRGKCSEKGHYNELVTKVTGSSPSFETVKTQEFEYRKPVINAQPISQRSLQYIKKRGISAETVKYFNIEERDFPQIKPESTHYVFPFYSPENELVFVKYRPHGKIQQGQSKAFREKGTKPILFNMNNIDITLPVVLTEGEFDTLAIHEAGYRNVVSVPSGAKDFSWIETNWEWLEKLSKVILFGDNDNAGIEMVKRIAIRLGEHKCAVVNHKYKDANELLLKDGRQAVLDAIEKASPIPKVGIVDVSSISTEDNIDIPGIPTGLPTIDRYTEELKLGDVTIWTGKNGEGKSTILGQVILKAIDSNNSVFCYSGELTQQRFAEWINTQAAGKDNLIGYMNKFGDYKYKVKEDALKKIQDWYRNKLYLYDNSIRGKNIENTAILDLCKYSAQRYGCKMFVIDNLMTADFNGTESDFYRAQSQFVGDVVAFAKAYNVHCHLVAHPKKTQNSTLQKEDISGTGDITNRADNVISIERNYTKDVEHNYDAKLKLLKNRENGKLIEVKLMYNESVRRFYEEGSKLDTYGWTNEPIEEDIYF